MNISDNKLVQESTNDSNNFDDLVINELFDLLSTKFKKQTFKFDVQKRQNLPLKIFDYIHTAKYRRLFLLL